MAAPRGQSGHHHPISLLPTLLDPRPVRQRTDEDTILAPNRIVQPIGERHMFIGGGILGTILVIALIFYVLRRS
jgi:hypothetical protein